jgi:hypothetical protein
MKLLLALLAVAILLGACKNNLKNIITEKVKDRIATAMNNENEQDGRIKELEKLKPMTLHEMEALFPDVINDFKFEVDNFYCANNMAMAIYRRSDGVELGLTVIDCAGENAGMFELYPDELKSTSYAMGGVEVNSKAIDFMGGKAQVIEYSSKGSNDHSTLLKYLVGDRLLIQASGEHLDIEQLTEVLKNLKLRV